MWQSVKMVFINFQFQEASFIYCNPNKKSSYQYTSVDCFPFSHFLKSIVTSSPFSDLISTSHRWNVETTTEPHSKKTWCRTTPPIAWHTPYAPPPRQSLRHTSAYLPPVLTQWVSGHAKVVGRDLLRYMVRHVDVDIVAENLNPAQVGTAQSETSFRYPDRSHTQDGRT